MKTARHNLYIPQELYEKIQYLADKDLRSFNKQCVHLLAVQVEQRRGDLRDFQQGNNNDETKT